MSGTGSTSAGRRPADIAFRVVMGVLLLVGVAGQVRVWLSDRGLWNDEIYIANNLKYLSAKGLTGHLLYVQVAPPGWLIGQKAILRVLGPNEQVLKLPEILAAIAVIILTAYAAYRAIGRVGAIVATALIAIAPMIYYYAGELKQYGFEAAIAMVIIVAAASIGRAAYDGEPSRKHLLTFAAVVAVASAGSYSSVMVLGGVMAGMITLLALRRRIRTAVILGLASAPGLAIGAGQSLYRRKLGFMHGQHDFFPHGTPPEGSGPIGILRWLPEMWNWLLVSPFGWRFPLVAVLLVAGGVAALILRKRLVWAAILIGVFAAAVGSGVIRGLPLEGRVALYIIAPVVIAVAAAVDGAIRLVIHAVGQWRDESSGDRMALARPVLAAVVAAATVIGLAAVVWPAAQSSYHQVVSPRYRDNGRDMLREVADRIQPGDVVLSYHFSEPLVSWYGDQWDLPLVGLAVMLPAGKCDPTTVDRALANAKRVWYVRGAIFSRNPDQYSDWVVAALARRGTIVDEHTGFKLFGGWTLVDLAAGPDPSPPALSTNPAFSCLNVGKMPR